MTLSSLQTFSIDSIQVNSSIKKGITGEIALYDAHNLDDCPWPQTFDGQYAKSFLTPLIQKGVSQYIENIQTDLRVLVWNDLVLPVTVNEAEYDNSYVCSPYSYFISYAKQSLGVLRQVGLRYAMKSLLGGFGKILQHFRINKVVLVNNWFYSTNLYPALEEQQVKKIVQFLQQEFPDHAIVFRCIDSLINPICYRVLQQEGFEYIATRQIFFLNPRESTLFESRLFKSDLKLLKNSGYEVINGEQLTEADIPRLIKLYRDLYIHKYSDFNPQFNEKFLSLALEHKLLHFKLLKKEGHIDGVVGYMQRNGKMYCPFFGYDCQAPKQESLFRLLSTVLMLEAYEHHFLFHQSAGSSMFKKIRKAHDSIEYTAVFYKHLKISRHLPWWMIKSLYNTVGLTYMKRY